MSTSDSKIAGLPPRIFSGIVLGLVLLPALMISNTTTAFFLGLLMCLGGWEMAKMTGKSFPASILMVALSLTPLMVLLSGYFLDIHTTYKIVAGLNIFAMMVMIYLIFNLWRPYIPYERAIYLLSIAYWGLPLALGVFWLERGHPSLHLSIFRIFILIWTSDTMAYVVGQKMGKTKLFPTVSPGKTVEGSIGALFFTLLTAIGISYFCHLPLGRWLFYGLLVWVLGTLGDLVESKMKRALNIKDSGAILPGHGGFLDRFDSFIVILPFFLFFEIYF